MKRGATVYLYELAWILPSIAIPVGMLAALLVTAFGVGIHVPSIAGRVDPTKVLETPPFDKPGLVVMGCSIHDEMVEADYATVTPQTKIKLLKNIFNDAKLVCVLERDDLVGVITKIDLIEYLASKRA